MMATDNAMDVDADSTHSSPVTRTAWVAPPFKSEFSAGSYDLYTDEEGLWVVYSWKSNDTDAQIEPFYERWPPSRTSVRGCAWIAVERGLSPYKSSLSPPELRNKFKLDINGLLAEFRVLAEGEGGVKVTPEMVDTLAVKYGVLSGKWLIYSAPESIDQLWRKVVGVVAFDRGYGQLKVSTRKVLDNEEISQRQSPSRSGKTWDGGTPVPGEKHVICVYVDDYTNKKDVDELRKALRLRAGVFWKIGFKPDVYTYLGIYKDNKWGLRPSRYHDLDNNVGRGGFGRT